MSITAAATSHVSFMPRATITAPPAAWLGPSTGTIRVLLLGGVFGYSNSTVSLGVQNAHDHIDSYQFAGYGSFTGAHLFADALLAYGHHGYALDRDGVIDTVHGSTGADTFTAAAKAGYLFNAGPVRAGPIAGVNYTGAVIQGYTETGDSLLTWMVNQQTLDSLTGNAGVQVRFPFELGGTRYSPFIDVTAEHYFPGSARTVTTTLVSAPLLPVLTPVSGESGTYGKVAAGVAARIAGNVSATFNAETTFAREGGNGVAVNGGIKVGLSPAQPVPTAAPGFAWPGSGLLIFTHAPRHFVSK